MMRTIRRVCWASAMVCAAASAMPGQALPAQAVRLGAPTVRIGHDEQPGAFISVVAGAVRLPNGHIVVGNRGGDHALLVFDGTGKFVRALARKGKGPAEVEYILRIVRCGNALFVSDLEGERVQEFTLDLVYKRAFRFSTMPYKSACNERRQFLHMGWEPMRAMRLGVYRADTPFWITPADSSAGISLGKLPGSERFGVGDKGKVRGSGPSLFGREPSLALSTQRAYVALGDSLHILVFDATGKPLRSIRGAYSPEPPTSADVELEIERQVASYGENARQRTTEHLRSMPRPRAFPATRDLHVDAAGVLWVQTYPSARRKTVTWRLFREDGTSLGTLELPTTFEVYEIGRDYLLGGQIDTESGIVEVQLLPLKL